MDIESELTLSYYKEIADINRAHGVFLVQHTENKRIYVKKVMSVYNAKIYHHLKNHPISGLPFIHELVEADGTLTIIEDYVAGETLEDIIRQRGKMSEDEAKSIMLQLCDTVDALHSFNPPMIHRDIKPSNVIITMEGSAVLLDMNAARLDEGFSEEDTTLLGTKGFAAPEQYGFGTSGKTADIYALGMLLNTMLTGSVSREKIAPGSYSGIIRKCVEMDPANRYESVYKLKQAILGKASWHRYLPPGFRTGNILHILVAILMYASIIITISGISSVPAGLPVKIFQALGFIAGFALLIAFTFNYLDFRRKIAPFMYRYNPVVRLILILVIDAIAAVIMVIFIVLGDIAIANLTNDTLFTTSR